jgi:subtilisin-like proprotein convertase family protein
MRLRTGWIVGILAVAGIVAVLAPLYGGSRPTYTTADAPLAITDNSGTFSACQVINVPSVAGEDTNGTDVNVSISATHTWVGDLTFRVQPPSGGNLTLINRPGRTGTGAGQSDDLASGTPILYDDAAPSAVSAEAQGAGCAGTIGVTAGCPNNYIPNTDAADTPIAGEGTNLAQWSGLTNVVGAWTLCAADSAAGDTGPLTSWSITFVGTTPVELQSFSID